MKDVFEKAGVAITKENRKDVDRLIHSIVGTEYKNCSATWKAVKVMLTDSEDEFVNQLKSRL